MISKQVIPATAALAILFAPLMNAREWINSDGRKIEADFVSADGTNVILKRNGKEISYAIDKLCKADQEFIRAQSRGGSTKPETAEKPVTGWISEFAITPAHADVKGYFTSRNFKAVYRAFDDGTIPPGWSTNKKGEADKDFAYDVTKTTAIVYVPSTYDGSQPYGIYLHISPGENGEDLQSYAPVMDRLKLIYVSARGTSNGEPMLRRIHISVDAVHSVRAKYQVDPKRICSGGYSGGGHMGMLAHACFPDLFMGSVSHAAQSYLPIKGQGHFPGLGLGELKSGPMREHRWCVISGSQDQNYQEILKTTKEWEANRFKYRFFDVPNMGHSNAEPEKVEEALKWVGL